MHDAGSDSVYLQVVQRRRHLGFVSPCPRHGTGSSYCCDCAVSVRLSRCLFILEISQTLRISAHDVDIYGYLL